jgi:hypothetical protein
MESSFRDIVQYGPNDAIYGISFLYSKAIPVTRRQDPWGCETSRLPHFLDNRLKDEGEFVSLMCLPLPRQEDSWYSFLLEAACGWKD